MPQWPRARLYRSCPVKTHVNVRCPARRMSASRAAIPQVQVWPSLFRQSWSDSGASMPINRIFCPSTTTVSPSVMTAGPWTTDAATPGSAHIKASDTQVVARQDLRKTRIDARATGDLPTTWPEPPTSIRQQLGSRERIASRSQR